MNVRLFAGAVPRPLVERIAPRGCVTVEPLPPWQPEGAGALRIAFRIDGLAGLHGVVASLSSTIPADYAFQFGMRLVRESGEPWSEWSRLTTVGLLPGDSAAARAQALGRWSIAAGPDEPGPAVGTDVDTFLLEGPHGHAELEVRVWTADPAAFVEAPCLLAVSGLSQPARGAVAGAADVPAIPMPAISQRVVGGALAERICSPTSVAMALGALGIAAEPEAVTRLAYAAAHDRYGVWPFNVWAASRWGALGYVGLLGSWECARQLLANGVPLVISEAHGPGELPGSPLERTDGHLLVLRGIRGGMALVHDPAAPDHASVPREYPLEDLARAWLGHGGVAYLFARPEGGSA